MPVARSTSQSVIASDRHKRRKWKEDDDEEEWTSLNPSMFYGISLEMREVDGMGWNGRWDKVSRSTGS